MSKDNGGAAFPSHGTMGEVVCEGMALRDYFAAKAMAAMITTSGGPSLFGLEGAEPETAKAAYVIADAMLSERAK